MQKTKKQTALIAGGGIAGLYAAILLDSLGYQITLIEQKPILGGRTYAFTDKKTALKIDNGQHLLIGAYHETLNFLDFIGAKHKIEFKIPTKIPLYSQTHKKNTFNLLSIKPPYHLAWALLNFKGMPFKDKWHLRKMLSLIKSYKNNFNCFNKDKNINEWLKEFNQSDLAINQFWEIITLATLNNTTQNASATSLLQVLENSYFSNLHDGYLIFPKTNLTDLFVTPSIRYLEMRGHTIIPKTSLKKINITHNKVSHFILNNNRSLSADLFVSALDLSSFLKAYPQNSIHTNLSKLQHSPIISINLFFDSPVMLDEFAGLSNSPVHWFFNKQTGIDNLYRIQGTISAAYHWLKTPKQKIINLSLQDLTNIYPAIKKAKLTHALVNKEINATLANHPNDNKLRPKQRFLNNFYVIGDWTQTNLPPTIESAARSAKNIYLDHLI